MQGRGAAEGDGAAAAKGHDRAGGGQAQEVRPAEAVRRDASGLPPVGRTLGAAAGRQVGPVQDEVGG